MSGAPKIKRPKPARGEAFGILNPWGDLWSHDTYETEAAARAHLEAFWKQPGFSRLATDLGKFKVVPIKITVSVK